MSQLNQPKGLLLVDGNKMNNSKKSMHKLILTGIVLAYGMTGSVHAASLLASGAVYGGPGQNHVACQVTNLGVAPINFLTKQFVGQFNANIIKNFDNCVGALGPNRICTFQAPDWQSSSFLQSYHCSG